MKEEIVSDCLIGFLKRLLHVLDFTKDADLKFIQSKVWNSYTVVLEKYSFTIRKKSDQLKND
jgi:hypothetical protein